MNFSLQPKGGSPAPAPPARDLPPRERPAPRRAAGGKGPLIVAAVLVGAAAVALTSVPGLGKSLTGLFVTGDTGLIKYKVVKTKLPITVVDRGSLESSKNMDVTNEVEGMTTIIKILPEGTQVKKGDEVCVLDSASLRDNLTNQEISTKRANADFEQTKKTLEVAEISVTEYVEGTFKQDEESARGSIKLAESELEKAKDRLEWSNRMTKIGYVSASQNYADKLALEKAKFSLSEAKKKLEVLLKYSKDKQVTELKANVEKARSDMLAKEQTHKLEQDKEKKLKEQIEKCKLLAPGDGLVVYANETNRFGGNNQPQIEEGAQVRERQKIFSLPDISRMRVNTKVHESMIDRISPGLPARIRVDAFANQLLTGKVESVQPLPDPSSFFSSDIKVYTTYVTIENGHPGLRPGMTAQVEILIKQIDDVLAVPLQAILEFKGKDYVYLVTPAGPIRREVKVGDTNDKLIVIKEGLAGGEEVALNPSSLLTEAEKREVFSTAAKGGARKEWSPDAAKAAVSPGMLPAGKGADAGQAKGKGAAAKKKRGGGGFNPAFAAKFQSIPEEDRAKLRDQSLSEGDRDAILKKAGFTDAEITQMKEMRKNMMNGGGPGGGGPPGGGGGFGGGPGGGGTPQ